MLQNKKPNKTYKISIKHNKNKHNKNKYKYSKKTKKNKFNINAINSNSSHSSNSSNSSNSNHTKHIGGSNIKTSNKNEKFEITTLSNVDPNKFSVSKYINTQIDWGMMPGPPPTDCCIC